MPYIYFGQYEGYSIGSLSIKGYTRSPFSHTSIFLPDLETVIEAWHKGVTKSHWTQNHSPATPISIYKIPCAEKQHELFYKFAHAQIGKSYDFGGIFQFVLGVFNDDKDKWFCSELFFGCAQMAWMNVLDIEPAKSTPRDVQLIPTKQLVDKRFIPGTRPEPFGTNSILGDT